MWKIFRIKAMAATRFLPALASAGIIGLWLLSSLPAAGAATGDDSGDGDGYSAGLRLGEQLRQQRQQGITVELDEVLRGLLDGLQGPPADPGGAAANSRLPSTAAQPPARERGYKDDYARLNAQRPGVRVLASGVQYEILEAGNGPRPDAGDSVVVVYQGSLSNGVVFDDASDAANPQHIKLSDIAVPGLREALQLMPVGSKWRVVIPPSMGFRNSGNNLLRRRDLIYEINLLERRQQPADAGG